MRNFSTHDLVITATYKNITSISQSIFQKTLKAGWNLVGVASKNDINGVISADNGLGASLPYSQILDFTGNGYSSGSFLDKAFTGNTQYYSGEAPLFKVYYSGERSFLKNISNLVSNSGYTITSKTSMIGKNLNEGLAYGIFVNNDTLISGSQKLTSAENTPYYTPPKVGVIPDIYAYSGTLFNIDLSQYVTSTDLDPILSYWVIGNQSLGLTTSGSILSVKTTKTGSYTYAFYVTDKDGWSNTVNFNLIISDTASLLNGQNLTMDLLGSLLGGNPPAGSLTAANKLATNGIINDNSANPANYNLNSFISKVEVAKISANVAGLAIPTACNNIFTDVSATSPNTWACGYTEALVNAGLYSIGSLKFYPESYISKSETLRLALESAGYTGTYTNPSNWQAEVVAFGVSKGIVTSFTDYNSPITKGGAYMMFSDARDAISVNSGNLLCQLLGNGNCGTTSTGTTTGTGTPPVVGNSLISATTGTPLVNGDFSVGVTPTDGDPILGYTLTGSIPAGLIFNNITGVLSGTATQTGSYALIFGATDKDGTGTGLIDFLLLAPVVSGTPPVVIGNILSSYTLSGANVSIDLNQYVTPTNGDTVSYGLRNNTVSGNLPSWLMFDGVTGMITGIPTFTGSYIMTFSAMDKDGTSTGLLDLTITAPVVVTTPPVVGNSLISATTGTPLVNGDFSVGVTPTDGDPILGYTLTGSIPAGLIFNNITGVLSGTATQTGSYALIFGATDKDGTGTGLIDFLLLAPVVVTTPPSIGTIPDYTFLSGATVNSNFNKHVTITDGNPILSYGLTGTLPTGLSFNTGSAIISGTTTQTGTYNMGFNATDIDGISNTSNFNIIVQ